MKNIFVGNLDFNTSEDELRQMFEVYGQVDRVSIMTDRETGRSRGFGFVEMANAEEGDKAIAALNSSQLGGRTLNELFKAEEQGTRAALTKAQRPNLTLSVNGVRIMARGGNWGLDEGMKRISRERLDSADGVMDTAPSCHDRR